MIFLRVLWDTVWRPTEIGDGSFHCPHCQQEQTYSLLEYRRWIAVVRAPVIQLKDWYRRVRCSACGKEFEDFVLDVRRHD